MFFKFVYDYLIKDKFKQKKYTSKFNSKTFQICIVRLYLK